MPRTWQNVIDEARVILQDTAPNLIRYTDSSLVEKLNRGLHEMARIRPDAFWDRFYQIEPIVPEVVVTDALPDQDAEVVDPDEDAQVALADTFDLPMQFFSPLVFYVAGSAELVDDEFVNDGRAMTLLNQFKQQLTGI